MATLKNRRKLAADLRETLENSRSGQSRNTLDPEIAQEYISPISEEIEGRVTKKLSKEFSRMESRILGALSKLDEFLLNPQVRTCSVAVLGTSRKVVYKKAFDTSRARRSVPHQFRVLNQVAFLRDAGRRTQTQKLYYINGGTQERKFNFIKIFFHLYVNGVHRKEKLIL